MHLIVINFIKKLIGKEKLILRKDFIKPLIGTLITNYIINLSKKEILSKDLVKDD